MFVIYQQQIFKFHRKLCPFIVSFYRLYSSDRKRESYFSAIGGKTDIPPPHLTPKQVNHLLILTLITKNNCLFRLLRYYQVMKLRCTKLLNQSN